MRVYLRQPLIGATPTRYVRLTLTPDLFGGWELVRESGEIGGRIQLRREQYLLQEEAQRAFDKARDSQLKRGYEITSAPSGDDGP
ncbi:WGR domain-containing protein [Stenotrophomonas sp. HITSZ_GD]|uniref:WGR domain-containing protein n=1 Tax=Stenotrophomonas sp. HITSZ_GD TaxID=3037248 RepID=UPI00240D3BC7|nr:WGR domain-containing protein [Stenotrophomonas sp. HITSZ_GD]MDG2525464.1 WGR domain-containing protein [Stenotrophomonas sp. HITSZ_GD]